MQVVEIKLTDIFADPTFNCRGVAVAPIDVADLARDIAKHGLQQPIVIQSYKDSYRVVAGHRRYTAFKVLKRETIPVIINNDLSEADALILNLGENIHRKDLTILQEANALERLKMAGLSVSDVSAELGKSSTWVSIRYMLLELPEQIRKAAAAGFISQSHIRQLHKLPDMKAQMKAARKIKDAKIRGTKVPKISLKGQKRNIFKIKSRDSDDVFWMMEHVQEHFKNGFGTRCLAWAAGEINDFDLFRDLQKEIELTGGTYSIPYVIKS